jgi:quinol monooxygenase YgiN
MIDRREFLATGAAAAAALGVGSSIRAQGGTGMYGLIGKFMSAPGKRDELIAVLIESVGSMPGCLSYIVAKDATDADGIWITEAWDSEASHNASLALPQVKAAIAKGKPMIAGFGERFVTTPVGGYGLASGKV